MMREPSERRVNASGGRPTLADASKLGPTILAAAQSVLEAKGYGGFSIDAVARGARVSKRTIYDRFADKDALLSAMILAAMDQWRSDALAVIDRSDGEDWLHDLIAEIFRLTASRAFIVISSFIASEGANLPEVELRVRAEHYASAEILAELLGRRYGALRDEGKDAAQAVLALLAGYGTFYRFDFGPPRNAVAHVKRARSMVEVVLNGYRLVSD